MGTRPRDELWDVLEEHFGEVRTPSERGRRNRAVRELRLAQATPEEVEIAIEFCEKNFVNFSEMAICSWFSQAIRERTHRGQDRETFIRLIEKGKK